MDDSGYCEVRFPQAQNNDILFNGNITITDSVFFQLAIASYVPIAQLYKYALDTDFKKMLAGVRLLEVDKPEEVRTRLAGKSFKTTGRQSSDAPVLILDYETGTLTQEMRYLAQRYFEYYRPNYYESQVALEMKFPSVDSNSVFSNALYNLETYLARSLSGMKQDLENLDILGSYPRYTLLRISNEFQHHRLAEVYQRQLFDSVITVCNNRYNNLLYQDNEFFKVKEKDFYGDINRKSALNFIDQKRYCCPICQDILLQSDSLDLELITKVKANCEQCLEENAYDELDYLNLLNLSICYTMIDSFSEATNILNYMLKNKGTNLSFIKINSYNATMVLLAVALRSKDYNKAAEVIRFYENTNFSEVYYDSDATRVFFVKAYVRFVEESVDNANKMFKKIKY